jgi:hypothetical protein
MLHVTYEISDRLTPGRLAQIDEDRGRVQVLLDGTAPLADVVPALNDEIDRFMQSAQWFQLWDDEIVSRDTPGRPLRIEYILDGRFPYSIGAGVAEDRGTVRVYINPGLTTRAFAAAMNPATRRFLKDGHWFQLYGGEIIDASPETMSGV